MGVVYRARQRRLNREVAIKMLLFPQFTGREAIGRFRVEAKAAAKLQHPHIMAIHDIGEADGQLYFSMDYVEGQTLDQLAHREEIDPSPSIKPSHWFLSPWRDPLLLRALAPRAGDRAQTKLASSETGA